jgi:hypothetical protein
MRSEEFSEIARKWADFVHHVTRTAFAIRAQDGRWALQYGFIAFSPEEIPTTSMMVETKSILAVREATDFGDARKAVIDSLLSDTASIQVCGHTLHLPPQGNAVFETYHGLHLPRFPGPQRLPSITVTRQGTLGNANALPGLLALDLELKSYSKPYDGLVELITELGNPFSAHEIGNSVNPRIEIAFAPPARISRSEIKDGVLLVDVVASPRIERSKLTLGLRLFAAKRTQVQRANFSGKTEWRVSGTLLMASHQQEVLGIGLIQIFLSYDGEFLGSMWARDQSIAFSLRGALHKVIDGSNAFAAKFFDDRNAFEEHVLALLSLLKLDCLYYGKMAELKDGPDILAVSDQGHLYVIECTTGDINNKGKLRRLYERTNAIRIALSTSAYRPSEVLPVMVASCAQSETLHCLDELRAYQIALVCREDIVSLLGQIEAPPTADRLFATALGTIPSGFATRSQEPAYRPTPIFWRVRRGPDRS